MRVAVVGATGVVGRTLIKLLHERGFPVDELVPFASDRSVGQELWFGEHRLITARELTAKASRNFDLVFCAADNDVSEEWVPRFNDAGACVIDLADWQRMKPSVPLVVPEVNPQVFEMGLKDHDGIIANPNCATIQMVVALKPIYDAVGIIRIVVSSMQSVSGAGASAVKEMESQARVLLKEAKPKPPQRFPHQIAFNAIPEVGGFLDDSPWSTEELKLMAETKKILGNPGIKVSPTCVRIPVKIGHSQDITIETSRPLSAADCRELLEAAPGVVVQDAPEESFYPMAINVTESDNVFVGRIRKDPSAHNNLKLWVVANNPRKGAATNAIQIAELLDRDGRIHP